MTTVTLLVKTLIDVYVMILLMRVWMQFAHCDPYNQFAQFIVKITHPIISKMRRIIPSIGPIDTSSVLLAYLLLVLKFPLLILIQSGQFLFDPYLLLIGLAAVLKAAGMLIFYVLLIRAIMSWISRGQGVFDYLLYQLTEPLLAPIRRVLPTFGGLDFSVMVVVFVLIMLNSLGVDLFGVDWYNL